MGSACPPLLGPHGPCLVDMCGQRLTSGWQTLESRTPLRESGVWPPGHRAQGPPVGKLSLQQLCSAAGGTHRLKQIIPLCLPGLRSLEDKSGIGIRTILPGPILFSQELQKLG